MVMDRSRSKQKDWESPVIEWPLADKIQQVYNQEAEATETACRFEKFQTKVENLHSLFL